jgi:phosphoribosylformylglycinamidine synthase
MRIEGCGAFSVMRGLASLAAYTARVYVSLKPTVNDPQGITIRGALESLGFSGVQGVRAGKYIVIQIDAGSQEEARSQVDEMCRKLLANPVIEEYRFDLDSA